MRTEKIRVLIADDHPVVCRGLAAIIQTDPSMSVVGQAANGKQAVQMFRQHEPEVTLMDLRMPVMSGVEAIRTICKEKPSAAIIVLTTYDGDEDICQALKAGARSHKLLLPRYIGELWNSKTQGDRAHAF